MKNIATLYYEAYKKREYITYEKDQIPEEGSGDSTFNLATNDSFRLQQYVEKTMERINTSQVDYKTCTMCADANVKTEEVRSIFESIFNNGNNVSLVKELITLMIASYMVQATNKDVASIAFFKFSTQVKPNTKDETLIRIKDIIEEMLNDNSLQYRKRKHRVATKLSYQKAFLKYFAFMIINANK